jgi:Protein of unknown function (DUF2997)
MVKRVTFKIDDEGQVSLSVEGTQGSECEDLTKPFEAKLGQVTRKTLTDRYYQSEEISTEQTKQTGEAS